MKTKFSSNSELAHVWANQQQSNGRGSSMFFSGGQIYSYGYHFMIANILEVNGSEVVLFTKRGYSNSTAKHINICSSAVNHKKRMYCYFPDGNDSAHGQNFNAWLNAAESVAKGLKTARKPENYLVQLSKIESEIKAYAELFNIDIPAELLAAVSISNKEELTAYIDKKEQLIALAEKQAKARAAKVRKEQIKKFLSFEVDRVYSSGGFDVIRVNGDNVETTQAVKIPVPVAKRIYDNLRSGQLSVGAQVLDYTVGQIDKKHVSIGCHTFEIKHLLEVGAAL